MTNEEKTAKCKSLKKEVLTHVGKFLDEGGLEYDAQTVLQSVNLVLEIAQATTEKTDVPMP